MENQFVTYEIALKLKELGFDEECLGFWYVSKINNSCIELRHGMCIFKSTSVELSKYPKNVLAPLWQQVIDWLREKQNICTNIEPITFDDEPTYVFEIINLKNGMLLNDINSSFIDSSEALEQAILEALELIAKNITK